MSSQVLGLVAAVALTIFVVELLRRGILREKFAVLWLVVAFGALVLAIYPPLLVGVASALGFEVPANLLFLVTLLLLLAVSVQLSFEVSKLDRNVARLTEDHVLLVQRVEQLEARARRD
jgi:hypothetical protein